MRGSRKRNIIATAIAVALLPSLAMAQDTTSASTATTGTTTSLDKVEVTGSRIKRTDVETVDPIQLFTAEDLTKQGYATLYDALSNLSVNTGIFIGEENTNNFNANAQALNLRGFGPGYTLVLLNGKRMPLMPKPAGNISGNIINLAMIPSSAVERVEVLTGGASACTTPTSWPAVPPRCRAASALEREDIRLAWKRWSPTLWARLAKAKMRSRPLRTV